MEKIVPGKLSDLLQGKSISEVRWPGLLPHLEQSAALAPADSSLLFEPLVWLLYTTYLVGCSFSNWLVSPYLSALQPSMAQFLVSSLCTGSFGDLV